MTLTSLQTHLCVLTRYSRFRFSMIVTSSTLPAKSSLLASLEKQEICVVPIFSQFGSNVQVNISYTLQAHIQTYSHTPRSTSILKKNLNDLKHQNVVINQNSKGSTGHTESIFGMGIGGSSYFGPSYAPGCWCFSL